MAENMIRFNTASIERVSAETVKLKSTWDEIWMRAKTSLGASAAEYLDGQTGASLEERNAEYQRQTTAFSTEMDGLANRLRQIAAVAGEAHANMQAPLRS